MSVVLSCTCFCSLTNQDFVVFCRRMSVDCMFVSHELVGCELIGRELVSREFAGRKSVIFLVVQLRKSNIEESVLEN
jgi:hypothetical protein